MNKNIKKFDVYEYVNNIILKRLETIEENAEYYLIGENLKMPYNPLSGVEYKGINFFTLYLTALNNNYTSNAWATFNQIKKAGGTVKKGSISEKIISYNPVYYLDGKKINFLTFHTFRDKNIKNKEELKRLKSTSSLKSFNIFHLSNVEGLDSLIKEYKNKESLKLTVNKTAKYILDRSGAKIKHKPVNVAYYAPSSDVITLPLIKDFVSDDKYYTTAFHELSHWTGHKTRLARCFNDESYAFEELIAEFSAAYLSVFCGIKGELKESTKYIKHWKESIKEDKYFMFKVINRAKKSSEFILDKGKN